MAEDDRNYTPGKPLDHRSLGRAARTSVMWAYARTGVIGLVGVPATIALARLLTPEDFGIAAAATFFGQLAGRLSTSGLGTALVRMKDLRGDHISTIFVVNVVLTVVGITALIAAAPYIGAFYRSPEVGQVLPLVSFNFALGALSVVQQALLTRDLRYRELATIGSLDVLVAAVTAVTFAFLGLRYWSLVLGDICGAFVKWVGGLWLVGWHMRFRFVPRAAREIGSFASASYAKQTLEHFGNNIDTMVIGRLLGVTALGFYDKAFSVTNKVFNKMTVVGPSVSFRILAIVQDEPERFRRVYRKVIMTATLVGYMVFGALAAMAPHLIVVAFGDRWRPTIVPLQILCAAFALKLLNRYANAAAQAKGWVWPQVWLQLLRIVLLVTGVYLAMPWGINGAAVAVLGAMAIVFVLMQTMMRKATGLRWLDIVQPQIPAVTAGASLFALLWGLDAMLSLRATPAPIILAAQVGATGLFMLAFAWWCPFRDARAVFFEIVNDLSPRAAGFVWKDVAADATAKAVARARRSKKVETPAVQ